LHSHHLNFSAVEISKHLNNYSFQTAVLKSSTDLQAEKQIRRPEKIGVFIEYDCPGTEKLFNLVSS